MSVCDLLTEEDYDTAFWIFLSLFICNLFNDTVGMSGERVE